MATRAVRDTVADRREALLRQIYEVNRVTIESGRRGDPPAILIPVDTQHDPHEAVHLVDKLQMGGVDVYRADAAFEADGQKYAAGTFVIPMAQVFAGYAKDMLEKQSYREVRGGPPPAREPPYAGTAWSRGMVAGAGPGLAHKPLAGAVKLTKLDAAPKLDGKVTGNGPRFVFDYRGPDAAKAINRLVKDAAHVSLEQSRVWVVGAPKKTLDAVASELGLQIKTAEATAPASALAVKAPRIGMYSPWTGGNMDEGWTRWVLEQYDFNLATLHNADVRAGKLRDKYDVIILPDQAPRSIVDGASLQNVRPEYRGGIGDEGVTALRSFLGQGGTLVTLGSASDLAIERFGVPLKNLKTGLTRDQHFAPGTILNVEVDTAHPLGYGMEPNTFGFYNNSPFFSLTEGFSSQKLSVVARYPNSGVVASGWLKGEDLMAGRAARGPIGPQPRAALPLGPPRR